MPKLFIKGQNDPWEITKEDVSAVEEARVNNEEWVKLSVGGFSVKSIKGYESPQNEGMQQKQIWELTTQELKEIIGQEGEGFENEYDERNTGERVYKGVLNGYRRGILDWAKEQNLIVFKGKYGTSGEYCAIREEFISFSRKLDAVRELKGRREYAQKKEKESMQTLPEEQWRWDENAPPVDEQGRKRITQEQFAELKQMRDNLVQKVEMPQDDIDPSTIPF